MKTTIESLREDAARRLRRETLSAAAICIVLVMGGALTATENLPALNGTTSTSAFLLGTVMGLFAVAAVVTIKTSLTCAARFQTTGRFAASTQRRTTSSRPTWSGRLRGRSSRSCPRSP